MKKRSIKNSTRKEKRKNFMYKLPLAIKTCCEDNEVDRISELPNDILVCILSFLNFREATATKILSSRWGRLDSTPNTLTLDFPSPLKQEESEILGGYIQTAKEKTISDYISRTNHTLDSYKGGQSFGKFKIDIPCVDGAHWKKWLEFALSKETEVIDISMIYSEYYTLDDFDYFSIFMEKCRPSLRGLKYLKELSLSGVYLDSYKNILTKFVFLERLSIESPQSRTYINLHGIRRGWVCKLKHLNISNVARNSYIWVCDMRNLVSLTCHGLEFYNLYLYNVPNLVDVSIANAKLIPYRVDSIYCVYAQLLRVRLYIRLLDREMGDAEFYMPKFTRVEHMELDIEINEESSNHRLFPLIQKCPFMEELEIQFLWSSKATYECGEVINKNLNGRTAMINKLKTVRLLGYRGSEAEFQFVSHVVENATNLKDLIFVEDKDGHENEAAIEPQKFTSCAFEHLRSVIPTSVNFRKIPIQ